MNVCPQCFLVIFFTLYKTSNGGRLFHLVLILEGIFNDNISLQAFQEKEFNLKFK